MSQGTDDLSSPPNTPFSSMHHCRSISKAGMSNWGALRAGRRWWDIGLVSQSFPSYSDTWKTDTSPHTPMPHPGLCSFFVIISHCHTQTEACEYTTQINDTHPEVAAVASVALTAISRNGVFNLSHFIFTPCPPTSIFMPLFMISFRNDCLYTQMALCCSKWVGAIEISHHLSSIKSSKVLYNCVKH